MRRILLLALLVLSPAVLAQGTPGQATLELDASAEELVVSRESSASFDLTVVLASDNPFDGAQPRQVRIVGGDGLPEGWIVRVSPERQTAPVDTPIRFRVTVDLTVLAKEDSASASFVAILVPRGAEETPLGGQIDPETQSAPASITLRREDSLSREVLENFGPWIWVALGVLAVAVLILVFVLANRGRPTVAMKTLVQNAVIAPGRSVAVPVQVENLSGNDDTIVFYVAPVPAGWAASLPVPDLPLDGGRREELHLVVTAPEGARTGDKISVGMTASSSQNPKRLAELIVDITVGESKAKQAAGDLTPADVVATRRLKASA